MKITVGNHQSPLNHLNRPHVGNFTNMKPDLIAVIVHLLTLKMQFSKKKEIID
jgi:hypothetical protein